MAAARRAGTGRRPHARRERLRLHRTQAPRGAVRRRLETSMESLITAGECSTMELPVLVSTRSANSRKRR